MCCKDIHFENQLGPVEKNALQALWLGIEPVTSVSLNQCSTNWVLEAVVMPVK